MENEATPFKSIKQSSYLPEEIIEEILSRLPVKSLLKFRCVSKPWRTLIGSKLFIKKHLDNSTNNPSFSDHNILFSSIRPLCGLKQRSLLSVLNDPLTGQFQSCDLENINPMEIPIVGCCNGLVCLLINGIRFMLWNPSTQKTKKLPDMDGRTSTRGIIKKYGFGYDDLSGDYKVLGIAFLHCRVYSLRANSWKTVEVEDVSPFCGWGKFASGKIHWGKRDGYTYITYFDLWSEVFDVIKAPITRGLRCTSMGVFGGRLGMLYDYRVGNFDIWVIKEYGVNSSWEKVVSIPYLHTTMNPKTSYLSLLGMGPNGEILLTSESCFEIFYPEGNGFRHCPVRGHGSFFKAFLYVESLVHL